MEVEFTTTQVDKCKIEQAITLLIEGIGDDPKREGLQGTPERVARMWQEFYDNREPKLTTFDSDDYDEIITINLPLYSFCEHHILPFFGNISIAYIPTGKVLGLSKLARIVDCYALRLSIQERLTRQIADAVCEATGSPDVAVIIKAEHLCMSMRGVKKPKHITTTSRMVGVFRDDPKARAEVLDLLR